jgi:hypothetical protein
MDGGCGYLGTCLDALRNPQPEEPVSRQIQSVASVSLRLINHMMNVYGGRCRIAPCVRNLWHSLSHPPSAGIHIHGIGGRVDTKIKIYSQNYWDFGLFPSSAVFGRNKYLVMSPDGARHQDLLID